MSCASWRTTLVGMPHSSRSEAGRDTRHRVPIGSGSCANSLFRSVGRWIQGSFPQSSVSRRRRPTGHGHRLLASGNRNPHGRARNETLYLANDWVWMVDRKETRRRNAMDLDLLDLYGQASEWAGSKVRGAVSDLDVPTTCDGWTVRTLMNHMLETQRYFVGSAQGDEVTLSQEPPDLLGQDPSADFDRARSETLRTFGAPGVIERTGPALGIAFSDQLLHGWDLAVSTGQDPTMPESLPEFAYTMIHGRFTEDQRKGVFKPEIAISPDSSPQAKLLAYTGRNPSEPT